MTRMIEKWMSATQAAGARWPALFALLALGGLHAALPSALILSGSRWLLLAVVSVLIVPLVVSHYRGAHTTNQVLAYVLNGVVTASMILSLALLIRALPLHLEKPPELLQSAASLWLANILVFASWYWRLDAGGPHKRAQRAGHASGAFLFPQMMMAPDRKHAEGFQEWSPNFVDYLFLAFNTSTAFSTTGSRWLRKSEIVRSTAICGLVPLPSMGLPLASVI